MKKNKKEKRRKKTKVLSGVIRNMDNHAARSWKWDQCIVCSPTARNMKRADDSAGSL